MDEWHLTTSRGPLCLSYLFHGSLHTINSYSQNISTDGYASVATSKSSVCKHSVTIRGGKVDIC